MVIKLFRLNAYSYFPYLLAFILGVAINYNWGLWMLPVVICLTSFTISGYALNFWVDARSGVDAIARPKDMELQQNPFLTGEANLKDLLTLLSVTISIGIISLLIAFGLVKTYLFLLLLVTSVILGVFCYNLLYWKSKPGLDILCIPIGTGGCLVLLGMLELRIEAMIYTFLTIALYLETEYWDLEEDRRCGLLTTAVWLGEKRCKATIALLFVLLIVSGCSFSLMSPNQNFGTVMALIGIVNLICWNNLKLQFPLSLVLVVCYIFLSV